MCKSGRKCIGCIVWLWNGTKPQNRLHHKLNLLLTGEYENVDIKYNFGRIYLESDGFNEQKADGITYRENYYK